MGYMIIEKSLLNQKQKIEAAELNHIKYGLFSINEWKYQLSEILNNEISNLDIGENKEKLKPLIEVQLSKLIDSVQLRVEETNKKKGVKGRMKQAFINAFVDVKDIKAGIPKYADEVIKIMDRKKSKNNIKEIIIDKVENYFDRTFQNQDRTLVLEIMQRHNSATIEEARITLDQKIIETHQKISQLTWSLLGLVALLFIVAAISKDAIPSTEYIVLVLSLFVLLICGVSTPMIDLEAKIAEMSFILLDHPVKFLNQVLYFQSKSVMDVFWLMITDPKLQMKVVGLLMVLFSVVFPTLKLLSSLFYYYNHWGLQKNKLIHFFVHKSGKWSMTDVMIIAIFMAYIGFSGVVSSQLGKLHSADQEIVLLTTNGTSLQPGFYLFMGYAVFALFLSEFLSRKFKDV